MLYRKEAVYAVYAVGQAEKIQQYQAKIEFRGQRGDAVTCGHLRSPSARTRERLALHPGRRMTP